MRLLLRVSALVLLSVFLSAQLAAAKAPVREPLIQDPVEFPAEVVCSFPVRLENVRGGQTQTTFANGVIRFTGSLWTKVTNLTTGRSMTVNSSGPGTITTNPDGTLTLKATGRALLFFFPGEPGAGGDGGLLRTTGLVVETFTADFAVLLSFSHQHGTTEDICQALE